MPESFWRFDVERDTTKAKLFTAKSTKKWKLPAASCRESSILKELSHSNRSLTPQQAMGNALAPGFKKKKNPLLFGYLRKLRVLRGSKCLFRF